MKDKLLSYLSGVSKELWLILSIVGSAGLFSFFIGGQRLILTFYNIPNPVRGLLFRAAAGSRSGTGVDPVLQSPGWI